MTSLNRRAELAANRRALAGAEGLRRETLAVMVASLERELERREAMEQDNVTILYGDCRAVLKTLPAQSVQCVVTSPPYYGLRVYSDDAREIGREPTPAEYVAAMVDVFSEVWRVLRDDGTLWLNLGDSYAGSWGNYGTRGGKQRGERTSKEWTRPAYDGEDGDKSRPPTASIPGLRDKNLIGIPWRVAFALQDAGWILRSDIIWSKPNAMPESVKDRPTRAHEYLFLFAKQPRYFYDAAAIAEPQVKGAAGSTFTKGKTGVNGMGRQQSEESRARKQDGHGRRHAGFNARWDAAEADGTLSTMRNKRTVWAIAPRPLQDEHYAPMPEALPEPCILAGSRAGDTVLDPFGGSGTTARVAIKHQRRAVLIELNEAQYGPMLERRTDGIQVAFDMSEAA